MRVDDFDFDLPPEAIALRPARPRDSARLLVVDPGCGPEDLRDRHIRDLLDELKPGDALLFNNTRVIPARLLGRRIGRGEGEPKIEATLLREEKAGYWQAFVRPAKKLEEGDRVAFKSAQGNGQSGLNATIAEKRERGEVALLFDAENEDFDGRLNATGQMPLPPYIASRRAPDEEDKKDYQTIYADKPGAVAAPTAGLHFTPECLEALEQKGISRHFVTLHVGAGTFLPVTVENLDEHKMHSEWGSITEETADALNKAKAAGGRIIAVGTTSLRLLESAADETGIVRPFEAETDIFISPGYRFKAADMLMTNFHLPKSTLFMLVSAFSGLERMKRAYAHAIENGYRFYSYGDACLLYPERASR